MLGPGSVLRRDVRGSLLAVDAGAHDCGRIRARARHDCCLVLANRGEDFAAARAGLAMAPGCRACAVAATFATRLTIRLAVGPISKSLGQAVLPCLDHFPSIQLLC